MKRKGFTLIEMMIVMIIIGILAGLIATGAFRSIKDARRSQAEAAISALETALAMYEADVGTYPLNNTDDNLFKWWLQDGDGSAGWNGPYMNFTAGEISGSGYLDPWGQEYCYSFPIADPRPFNIWSVGPDGAWGGGDDIYNW